MAKLTLNPESLQVQSFQTSAKDPELPASPAAAAMYGTSRCAYTDCTCGFTICQETE